MFINPALVAGTLQSGTIAAVNTNVTVTSNGSVTSGNLQVVFIEVAGAVAPTGITAPGGWSTILATTATATGGLVSAAIFYKQATATGAFSGSFSWTTASTGGEWLFTEWACSGASFVDGASVTNLNASGTSPTSPAITPGTGSVADTLIGVIFGGVLSTSTISIPAGMTSVFTVSGGVTVPVMGVASLNLASAATAGAETWTLGSAEAALGVSFLLQQGTVSIPSFAPQYVPPENWMGAPSGITNEVRSLFTNALQAPLYAPRPPDPQQFIWQGNPTANGLINNLTYQKIFGAGGQVPTKTWRWDHVPPPDWLGEPEADQTIWLTTTQQKIYGQPGQGPTKFWRWDHVPQPDWVWVPPPSTIPRSQTEFYVLAKQWRWDHVSQPDWVGSATANKLLVEIVPFNKQWRWDYVPDPPWAPTLDNLTANILFDLTAGGNPFHKQWRWDFEPDKFWQGSPLANPALENIVPFSKQDWRWDQVPLPDWMPPIDNLTANTLYLLEEGGTPFSKQWRYDLEPDKFWQGPLIDWMNSGAIQLTTTQAKFFGQPGQAPTKQWQWSYDFDKFWQWPAPQISQALTARQVTGAVQAPFYAPRPPPPPDWSWQPPHSAALEFTTIGGTPFYQQWRWDQVPQPDWFWGSHLATPALTQLLVLYAPAGEWNYDSVPAPDWMPALDNLTANVLYLLGATPFSKQWRDDLVPAPDWAWTPSSSDVLNIFVEGGEPFSKQWRYDLVPPTDWVWAPPPSDTLRLETAGTPFFQQWRYDNVPVPDWVWVPPSSDVLKFLTAGGEPFSRQWRYDFDQPDKLWLGSPLASLVTNLPSTNPFLKLWRWDQVPPPDWSPSIDNLTANILYALTAAGQPPTKLWQWNYEFDKFWQGSPSSSNTELLVPLPIPFFQQWRWDQVPSPDWVWAPPPSDTLRQLSHLTPFSKQDWRWDYHIEQPLWQWTAPPSETIFIYTSGGKPAHEQWRYDLVPPTDWTWMPPASDVLKLLIEGGNPFHKQWLWDHVPQPDWSWRMPPSNAIRLATVGGTPAHKQWLWDHVPPPDWSWRMPPSNAIRLTTFGGRPFVKTWHYDFDSDPKPWQWSPLNVNIRPVSGFVVTLGSGNYTYTGFPISTLTGSALRVGIGLNVFCLPIYQSFSGPVLLPPEPLLAQPTHPRVGDPATLFIPLLGANNLPLSQVALEQVTLTITRPDGSFYLVPGPSPFVFFTPLFASYYMVYQTAPGELNQQGWWQITFNAGQAAPGGYVFYIGPPFPDAFTKTLFGQVQLVYVTEDGSETYVTEDGSETYTTEDEDD